MIDVIERCFASSLQQDGWAGKLKTMIPSYGQRLIGNTALAQQVRAETAAILHLQNITV
jgi:malate dehydrogenase (quinone)